MLLFLLFDKYLVFGFSLWDKVLNYVKKDNSCLFLLCFYILSTIAATVYNRSKVFFDLRRRLLNCSILKLRLLLLRCPLRELFMAPFQITRCVRFEKKWCRWYWIVFFKSLALKLKLQPGLVEQVFSIRFSDDADILRSVWSSELAPTMNTMRLALIRDGISEGDGN